jgi:hypothetical protein
VQLEVDDPRRISVHLAPIPQPATRDNIVTSQKSRFEDQDKTISKWPPAEVKVYIETLWETTFSSSS